MRFKDEERASVVEFHRQDAEQLKALEHAVVKVAQWSEWKKEECRWLGWYGGVEIGEEQGYR